MLAGGVALGGLLLTSCALPGTTAPPVGNIGTVHVAGVPAVAAPPAIVVTPSNSAVGVALDAPIVVAVSTGHLDTVSLSEAGSSTALPGAMSPDGRSWEMSQPLDQGAHYTVVAADLRGYGDSAKPAATDPADHTLYSKRAMALDQVEMMAAMGHSSFFVLAHDRGARVAHRMALDYPDAITRLAVVDIAPTATMYARTNKEFATRYFWWFFLIQPAPLPERLIGADPEFFLRKHLEAQTKAPGAIEPEAFAEYLRCYNDPATRHAICEDYRAAAGTDLADDDAALARGQRVTVPLLALWGEHSFVGGHYPDVLAIWREYADQVTGRSLPCGHYLAEEVPLETTAALLEFLKE